MARNTKSVDAGDDPTLGGAIPDPTDDSPRGRFARGEIDAYTLNAELSAAAGTPDVDPPAPPTE